MHFTYRVISLSLVAALAGCLASDETSRGPAGAAGAFQKRAAAVDFTVPLELDVCMFQTQRPKSVGWQTPRFLGIFVEQFESRDRHIAPFRSYREVKSLEDSATIAEADCDIVVEIGAIGKKRGVWTYSARTKEQLFKIAVSHVIFPKLDAVPLRKAVYSEFRTNPELFNRILAERGRATPQPAAAAAPAAAVKIHSDIDTPGYRMKERPHDFAVVIRIDGYKDLPSAQFAERDAETMRAHLLAMGLPKRHVVLLKGKQATGNGMRKYLDEWLPRNVSPDSNVFFYYSGHGAPDTRNGKAYLVPWDGDAQFLKSTAYPVEKLYASLNQLKAKRVVIALDACFSGAGGRSVLAKGARPLVLKIDEGVVPKGKLVLFTAAAGGEITSALEQEGHGIFTYFFLKGLQGAAKDAAGRITAKSLYDYLKPKVQDEARLQNREQTPTAQYRSDVVLRGD
ncbi:MAG: caspase family protein [Elusimicrobiota bacterium]